MPIELREEACCLSIVFRSIMMDVISAWLQDTFLKSLLMKRARLFWLPRQLAHHCQPPSPGRRVLQVQTCRSARAANSS
jgi:hypothetical protein